MKRIVETADGGYEAMLGEKIFLMCGCYFYAGVLAGVNEDHLELEDAKIVYETGPWNQKGWSDAQSLPGTWRIMKQAIESWGKAKC